MTPTDEARVEQIADAAFIRALKTRVPDPVAQRHDNRLERIATTIAEHAKLKAENERLTGLLAECPDYLRVALYYARDAQNKVEIANFLDRLKGGENG